MKAVFVLLSVVGVALAMPKTSKWEVSERRMGFVPAPGVHFSGGNTRVIGGSEVEANSIPYQLRLVGNDLWSSWSCGASLISENYALTAAHCVDGALTLDLLLGAHNIKKVEATQVEVTSTKYVRHADYNADLISDDIAVIKLPSPVTPTSAIGVISLPNDQTNESEGANVKVSGWGITRSYGSTTSSVLRAVNSTILNDLICDSVFIDDGYSSKELCISGAKGVGSCSGDSGGPLVSGNEQVGIVSYGVSNCISGYPSYFTRVSAYSDWISENTDL